MVTLVLGFALIITAFLSIRFPELVRSIRENDNRQWVLLGSPGQYAFSKTIGVYSWIIHRGYEESSSDEVKRLGQKALHKALFARHSLMFGTVFVVVGFISALFGI